MDRKGETLPLKQATRPTSLGQLEPADTGLLDRKSERKGPRIGYFLSACGLGVAADTVLYIMGTVNLKPGPIKWTVKSGDR